MLSHFAPALFFLIASSYQLKALSLRIRESVCPTFRFAFNAILILYILFIQNGDIIMADLLLARAVIEEDGSINWQFVDEGKKHHPIHIAHEIFPDMHIGDGDQWQVEIMDMKKQKGAGRPKIAHVRLIAQHLEQKDWHTIEELEGHWFPPSLLRALLILLNNDPPVPVVLKGPPGTGKTTLAFSLAKTLGWQTPCKVDIPTIKRIGDLFGSDSAESGSTDFIPSRFSLFIKQARIAWESGEKTIYPAVFDELNRVHAKVIGGVHGFLDDTRRVTITTIAGSKTFVLTPNVVLICTINDGPQYQGAFGMDLALKDRCAAFSVPFMPFDVEVKRLTTETGIVNEQAETIVRAAGKLRSAADAGRISFWPSYRQCRSTAYLAKHGVSIEDACKIGLLGWCQGDKALDDAGHPVDANSEFAKAYSEIWAAGALLEDVKAA